MHSSDDWCNLALRSLSWTEKGGAEFEEEGRLTLIECQKSSILERCDDGGLGSDGFSTAPFNRLTFETFLQASKQKQDEEKPAANCSAIQSCGVRAALYWSRERLVGGLVVWWRELGWEEDVSGDLRKLPPAAEVQICRV